MRKVVVIEDWSGTIGQLNELIRLIHAEGIEEVLSTDNKECDNCECGDHCSDNEHEVVSMRNEDNSTEDKEFRFSKLFDEFSSLSDKIARLENFTKSEECRNLEDSSRGLLESQLFAMKDYRDILFTRIDNSIY